MIKSINLDENILKEIELAIKGLNLKTGASIYDFSSIIRIALNQYLNSNEIKEIIKQATVKENNNELLYMAESSLSKDWLSDEEDDIWQNL
jgi:hypothetical protein